MGGVDQRRFFATNEEGIVGGAVLQAEFDVEAIAIPIQRANRRRLVSNTCNLHRKALLSRVFSLGNGGNHSKSPVSAARTVN